MTLGSGWAWTRKERPRKSPSQQVSVLGFNCHLEKRLIRNGLSLSQCACETSFVDVESEAPELVSRVFSGL